MEPRQPSRELVDTLCRILHESDLSYDEISIILWTVNRDCDTADLFDTEEHSL